MVGRFIEERLTEASFLPLWLHVGSAMAHEPRATDKACIRSRRELKILGNTSGDMLESIDQKNRLYSGILMSG